MFLGVEVQVEGSGVRDVGCQEEMSVVRRRCRLSGGDVDESEIVPPYTPAVYSSHEDREDFRFSGASQANKYLSSG